MRRRLGDGGGVVGGMMLRVEDDRHFKLVKRNFKIMVAIKIFTRGLRKM